MAANLRPLEDAAVERLENLVPNFRTQYRIGEHDQTAFATRSDTRLCALNKK